MARNPKREQNHGPARTPLPSGLRDLRVYHDLVPEVMAALQATAPSTAKAK